MTSTSNSKASLVIKDLHVKFNFEHRHRKTLRDKFISFIQNPIKELTRKQEKLHVLKGINLSLKKGDRLGIIGKNGAGKTTLCKIISKIYSPTEGTVRSFGKVRPVFNTSVSIFPDLTGRENCHIMAKILYPDLPEEKLNDIVEEAIEFSELGKFIDTPFVNYSTGMKSRISLSIISALPADILILDEVFDGADIFFQKKMAKRILNVIHQSGSVIFISHNFDQIKDACNRAILIEDGMIAADGPPNLVFQKYLSSTKD